jgi:hypothetical protein
VPQHNAVSLWAVPQHNAASKPLHRRPYEVKYFVTHLCPQNGDNPEARRLPPWNIQARSGNQTRNSITFRLWAQTQRPLVLRPWKWYKSKWCDFPCHITSLSPHLSRNGVHGLFKHVPCCFVLPVFC